MPKERDYLTLDEVEEYTGIKKNSLYYYLRTLDIKTHKFILDKRAYISLADANHIKEVKDTPWLAGEKPSQKAEKQPIPQTEETPRVAKEKAPTRVYMRKKDTALPDGCIPATDFANNHGVNRRTFQDHIKIGLGKGLIHGPDVPEDGSVLVKDYVRAEKRPKPSREHETEYYLTTNQQKAALEFWKRHDVAFIDCNDFSCWCRTLKKGE
jgi:hypothetical protein